MADDYVLRPVLDKTYMEHEFERAFKHVESGQAIGKIVMKFRYVNIYTYYILARVFAIYILKLYL